MCPLTVPPRDRPVSPPHTAAGMHPSVAAFLRQEVRATEHPSPYPNDRTTKLQHRCCGHHPPASKRRMSSALCARGEMFQRTVDSTGRDMADCVAGPSNPATFAPPSPNGTGEILLPRPRNAVSAGLPSVSSPCHHAQSLADARRHPVETAPVGWTPRHSFSAHHTGGPPTSCGPANGDQTATSRSQSPP